MDTLKIGADELQKRKLFVCTPMYGGKCYGAYLRSCLMLIQLCTKLKICVAFSAIYNESLIQRGRNYLVDEFMRSDFTHLMFIDTDIEFKAEDVIALLIMDKEVAGAHYPDKKIYWGNIIESARNYEIHPDDLFRFGGDNHNLRGVRLQDTQEVDILKTGFMMVKRSVFQQVQIAYPEYYYKPDHIGHANFDGRRKIQLFFSVEIDQDTEKMMTEYEFFCKLWKKIGGKSYLCPWITLRHHGPYSYQALSHEDA